MRVPGKRLSRLDLALVAVALLLPVPLVALNGYAAALPDAVGRGLGSLVTLEAGDDSSGLKAGGDAAENGSDTRRSANGALAVTRARPRSTSSTDEETAPSASAGHDAATEPSDDTDTEPEDEGTGETADTGGESPSGERSASSGGGEGSSAGSGEPRGLSLTIGGGGTASGVGAGSDGVSLDLGADSGDAGDGNGSTVTVELTDEAGSSTGTGLSVPGSGLAIP